MTDSSKTYGKFWNRSNDTAKTTLQTQLYDNKAIAELNRRIKDLEKWIKWHEDCCKGDNGMSGYFKQLIFMDKASVQELKNELAQVQNSFKN